MDLFLRRVIQMDFCNADLTERSHRNFGAKTRQILSVRSEEQLRKLTIKTKQLIAIKIANFKLINR